MAAPKTIVAASGWCYRSGSRICARSIKAGLTTMGVGAALRGFSAQVSRPMAASGQTRSDLVRSKGEKYDFIFS